MICNFLQRAAIEISFDVRWSLVAQAIPENEPFLQKMSIFRNRYCMLGLGFVASLAIIRVIHICGKFKIPLPSLNRERYRVL